MPEQDNPAQVNVNAKELYNLLGDDAKQLFPRHLYRHHPHVVANMVEKWRDPNRMYQYLSTLFLAEDRRKQGFSNEVMSELIRLRDFYQRLKPFKQSSEYDVWSKTLEEREN